MNGQTSILQIGVRQTHIRLIANYQKLTLSGTEISMRKIHDTYLKQNEKIEV